MNNTARVRLSAGPMHVELQPGLGGSVATFTRTVDGREWPIFRGAEPDEDFILNMGSFPLLPWVNRVRDGGFTFRGRDVRLKGNPEFDPSPLHGHGWLSPWQVDAADGPSAVLSFSYPGGDWPWPYDAEQRFALDEDGLSIRLSCTNRSDAPMPCGLGHHPYFLCGPDTTIDTVVSHTWTIDELVLPVERVPADGQFSMRQRKVCAQDLDHGFGGWGGRAEMRDPQWPLGIAFSSPTARFFQLYSPPGGGFFVAEPVTHANTALNAPEAEWPELGMQVLEPQETMVLESRFEVFAS